VHTVAKGETVSGIARRYGTTSERLMKLNGLKKAVIFPGQSLIVASAKAPKSKRSSAKAAAERASAKAGTTRKSAASHAKKSPAARKHSGGSKNSSATKKASAA
jgi:LysM repeat protein